MKSSSVYSRRHRLTRIVLILFLKLPGKYLKRKKLVYETEHISYGFNFLKLLWLFVCLSGRKWLEICSYGGGQSIPLDIYNCLCVWNCRGLSTATTGEHRKILRTLSSEIYRPYVCCVFPTTRKVISESLIYWSWWLEGKRGLSSKLGAWMPSTVALWGVLWNVLYITLEPRAGSTHGLLLSGHVSFQGHDDS